ncbi:CAP domain-containing protein [Rhizobiaceae bacterium BDR2-2]|uniref:CAP domain-containing protein n=1 Tax=Ectorhizobium quercum TaxID=2965071 RepID=A0AAE3SV57_9HYPH|nr:CAP domain-containing protein [Ectorhizobium quercum]MCX8995995.1 CAP domain-containing protein [Ectorhizobium quercum]
MAIGSLCALVACTGMQPQRSFTGTAEDRTAEALGAVNELRASKGLPALAAAQPTRAAALDQARRMAANGQMKHLMGLGDSFGARMRAANVPLPAAENIAAGQQATDAAVKAWIASPRHLENMLGPSYTALGVAVARDPASGNRPYWAMVLSR